jgi:hypothetical protein
VIRRPDPKDRRGKPIAPTKPGKRLIDEATAPRRERGAAPTDGDGKRAGSAERTFEETYCWALARDGGRSTLRTQRHSPQDDDGV